MENRDNDIPNHPHSTGPTPEHKVPLSQKTHSVTGRAHVVYPKSGCGHTWIIAAATVLGLATLIAVPAYMLWIREDKNDEPFDVVRSAGNMHDIVINSGERSPSIMFRIADELCGENAVCDIRYWGDSDKIPQTTKRGPLGEDALYARDRDSGIEMIIQGGREFRR